MSDKTEQILDLTKELLKIKEKDIVSLKRLGDDLNFSVALPDFERSQFLLNKIYTINFQWCDSTDETVILAKLIELKKAYQAILQFSSASQNSNQRDQQATVLRNAAGTLQKALVLPLSKSLIFPEKESDELQDKVSAVEKYLVQLNELKDGMIAQKKELDMLLIGAKKAVGELGVSKYAGIFLAESKKYNNHAIFWILMTIICIASLICLAISVMRNPSDAVIMQLLQISIAKILIVSGIVYALSICLRNYRASMHNSIVNKHKHNALSTFETFVGAVKDGEGKEGVMNAILLEATNAIFSAQQTGYLQKGAEELSSKVIEIVKNVPSRGGE